MGWSVICRNGNPAASSATSWRTRPRGQLAGGIGALDRLLRLSGEEAQGSQTHGDGERARVGRGEASILRSMDFLGSPAVSEMGRRLGRIRVVVGVQGSVMSSGRRADHVVHKRLGQHCTAPFEASASSPHARHAYPEYQNRVVDKALCGGLCTYVLYVARRHRHGRT